MSRVDYWNPPRIFSNEPSDDWSVPFEITVGLDAEILSKDTVSLSNWTHTVTWYHSFGQGVGTTFDIKVRFTRKLSAYLYEVNDKVYTVGHGIVMPHFRRFFLQTRQRSEIQSPPPETETGAE